MSAWSSANEPYQHRLVLPDAHAGASIQARFTAFHEANPWVYEALVRLARKYRDMGRSHIGIGHLVEIVRWEYAAGTQGDEFKINNNFRSRFVRLIQQRDPELAAMFETRELRAA